MLNLILDSITRSDLGIINIHVWIVNENGDKLSAFNVDGQNAQEIEDKLRPRLQKFKNEYDAQNALRAMAQEKLDILKAEFGFGS